MTQKGTTTAGSPRRGGSAVRRRSGQTLHPTTAQPRKAGKAGYRSGQQSAKKLGKGPVVRSGGT